MSQLIERIVDGGQRSGVGALSGPSFAREVAAGMPTAVTAAARDLAIAEEIQRLFNGPTLRVYSTNDITGVEIGAAVKNVVAVAAGVSDGLGFGHNARVLYEDKSPRQAVVDLMTRGLRREAD